MRFWFGSWNGREQPASKAVHSNLRRLGQLRSRKPVIDLLEDRRLLSVSSPAADDPSQIAGPVATSAAVVAGQGASYSGQIMYTDFPAAAGLEPIAPHVVGRDVFYNNSPQDGNDPNANAADDGAIALDKAALLPGGTAAAVNYTTTSQGINGIMIDVASLRGVPTLEDFAFKVGNTANPSQWSAAAQPTSITSRAGAGAGGSTRITITWADHAIQDEWLQVTLKATVATGLSADDVFYFGNSSSGGSPLVALAAPSLPVATAPRQQPELFDNGDAGTYEFFAPNLVVTTQGTVLAIAEARFASQRDNSAYAIVMRRSFDNGATWSEVSTVYGIAPNGPHWVGNAAAVVDAVTGDIFILFCEDNNQVFVVKSSDDGFTWSAPTEITNSVKVTSDGNPNPSAFPSTPWTWYATGPGHGIQLEQGVHAGRLVIACDHQVTGQQIPFTHVIYSDDHGLTWHLGGGLDQTQAVNNYSDEASVVERSDGSLYMSIRVNNGSPYHGHSLSFDGGATWSNLVLDTALTTFPVEGSIIHINANTYVFSSLDSGGSNRQQMTIWVSYDNMTTWVKSKVIDYTYASYSDMVQVGPNTVLLAYDAGRTNNRYDQYISLAAFNLDWLQSTTPDEFTWDFNEQAPGQLTNLSGPSIFDSSPWDNRAQALAPTPAQAPVYVAGVHANDSALEITPTSSVQLTPNTTYALQFAMTDSFTTQLVMRTTDSDGVIIGTTPDVQNWTLQVVNGFLQFSIFDRFHQALIQSSTRINDGQWHRIAVVRDAVTRTLSMYIDGVQAATPVDTTAVGTLKSSSAVTLGAYNDGSSHLDFDVDTLRVTRAALTPAQFLAASYTAPPRAPLTALPADAPNSIPGLQLWLPAYDPTRVFADPGHSDPAPLSPVSTTAIHSILDVSPNQYVAAVTVPTRQLLYNYDPAVGSNWSFQAPGGTGERLLVQNSNGSGANNFDFVQNTGVFTISTFVKLGPDFSTGYMTLFDTADTSTINPGFTLKVTPDGALNLAISGVVGGTPLVRFSDATAPGTIANNTWYQVVVVGNGMGNAVTYYVTPVTSPSVVSTSSSSVISGANGSYPTDSNHNLAIGSSNVLDRGIFNGQMVDQAIYNRALSVGEIQQLFHYTTQAQLGPGVGSVYLSQTNLDYGVVPYQTTPSKTLRVVNGTNDDDLGSATNLTLLSAQITGPGASHFSVTNFTPGMTIASGAEASLNVQFNGGVGSLALYNATLTLVTDRGAAPGSPGQTFTIPLAAVLAAAVDLNGPAAGTGHTTTWINAGPVSLVDPASATIIDAGNTAPVSLTATLSNPQPGDVLGANTAGTNITASYSAGTLSLTGTDTLAHYQSVLRTLTYHNTLGGPGILFETVSIVALDGTLPSATATSTVIVDLAAPVVDLNGAAAGTGYSTPWTIFGPVNIADAVNARLTDLDSANLVSLTVTLANPQSGDVLAADTSGTKISASFAGAVLVLTGNDLAANYEKVLRTITYDNTLDNPGVATETVRLVANDGMLASAVATSTINIDMVPPVIDLNGAAAGNGVTVIWTGAAVNIADSAHATIVDPGSATLQYLTVVLTKPALGDVLAADTTGTNLVAAFVNNTLVLSGTDSVANYQQVLRSVTYNNIAGGPGVNTVAMKVVGYDGTAPSNTAISTVNLPPVLNLSVGASAPNFSTTWYNNGPVPITNMSQATVTDPAGLAKLTSLTVKLATFTAGDVLSVPSLPGVSITSSYSFGTLSLSGSDSVANYLRVLRFVSYNNTSGGPNAAAVLATFVASDGTFSSSPVTSTINIRAAAGQVLGNRLFYNNSKYDGNNGGINANDDAAIASDKTGYSGNGSSSFANISAFSRGITGIMVDLQSGIGHHSLINLTSGDITFRVAPSTYVTSTYNQLSTWVTAPTPTNISVRLGAGTGGSDRLEIIWANGAIKNTWLEVDVHAGGNTGLSADDVFFFGSVVGDSGSGDTASLAKTDVSDYVATNNNITSLTTPVWNLLDYSKDGKVDVSDANLVLSNVFSLHYLNNAFVSDTPPVVFLVAPSSGPTPSWVGAGPVTIAASGALTGAPNMAWLDVGLAGPRPADLLAANTAGTNITSSFANGTLHLSGADSLANYQQVLRSVTYDNTSPSGPGVDFEIVQVTANDGIRSSAVASVPILMPPVLNLTIGAGAPNYTTGWYNSGPVPITNMAQATLTDPAGMPSLSSLTVTLTTFHTGDVLALSPLAGLAITSTYAAGTLTLSGSDTAAHYQRALRYISYDNTAGGPGVGAVTVTVVASDGLLPSNTATATINVSVATGQVLGNRLFYNNSKYDGNNGGINANDDAAIASDKVAYNGSGTATYANISAFTRGITGVMVDLQSGIGNHSLINLTSGDITFRVAPATFVTTTYNQVSNWSAAPTPTNISVRLGAGTGGSDRIEITWANGAIKNTWLEVDVHAGGHTGLTADDVFYFGSAIADSGVGDRGFAKTDVSDYLIVNNNIIGLTTPIWNVMDYSKDGKVDITDANAAINNVVTLHYLTSPTGPFAPDSGGGSAAPQAAVAAAPAESSAGLAAIVSGLNPTPAPLVTSQSQTASDRPRSTSASATVASGLQPPHATDQAGRQFLQTIDQIAERCNPRDEALERLLSELGLE